MSPILWSIALCLLGLMLILLDALVPSGGVLTVLGSSALIGSVVAAFLVGPAYGGGALFLEIMLLGGLIAALVKWWPHSPLGRRILIQPSDRSAGVEDERMKTLNTLIGATGVARSKMLLSGAVELDGQLYDAVSAGEAVDVGQKVRVVKVRARQLVVQPIADPADGPDASSERHGQLGTGTNPEDPLSRPIEELGLEPFDDPLA